eukprot:scaffold330_cov109-Isochrysis_galbana.AAC.17
MWLASVAMRPAQLLGAPAADGSARAVAGEPPQRARQATVTCGSEPGHATGARWRRRGRRLVGGVRLALSGNAPPAPELLGTLAANQSAGAQVGESLRRAWQAAAIYDCEPGQPAGARWQWPATDPRVGGGSLSTSGTAAALLEVSAADFGAPERSAARLAAVGGGSQAQNSSAELRAEGAGGCRVAAWARDLSRLTRGGGSPWPRRRCWRGEGAISRRGSGCPRGWRRIKAAAGPPAPARSWACRWEQVCGIGARVITAGAWPLAAAALMEARGGAISRRGSGLQGHIGGMLTWHRGSQTAGGGARASSLTLEHYMRVLVAFASDMVPRGGRAALVHQFRLRCC